jgi:steroid delta-isomerase-like uncharacterized protein
MDDVERVREYWEQVWSQGRTDVLAHFYAPSYRENDDVLTQEMFADHVTRWRAKFTGFRADVDRVWTVPGAVVSRVHYTGTHTGDLQQLPATGRTFRLSGLDVFEFQDGRVVQHWHETDHWNLFEELGYFENR